MGKEKLLRLLWDSPGASTADQLLEAICGSRDIPVIDRRKLIARMLVSIRWHDLVEIFGLERMRSFLDEQYLDLIWKKELRNEYAHVREVLERVLRQAV